MSTADMSNETAAQVTDTASVDFKLEVVVLPVSDADRAKQFYASLGWREDADFPISEDYRVLQFTPPGSSASIVFGTGVTGAVPGSAGNLLLAVSDIDAARAQLIDRGVDVSEVFHGKGYSPGTEGRVPGPDPERKSYGSWASFSDPDGNEWLLQEIKTRLPGR
jgi:catechol 2,3-dioxygenase-like lactoylglutathione lyase family enzyme